MNHFEEYDQYRMIISLLDMVDNLKEKIRCLHSDISDLQQECRDNYRLYSNLKESLEAKPGQTKDTEEDCNATK